ncbi:MAG: bifunctional DNA-formamidopyrimidine glycosylase/DNA-(apurinic or apyrimidinic site) lyase [Geobacteraceae bacterium]|nr:bifunctional DNA-formamidopyrimidine glycosylase/DNA-(apurinic or apyrimidinic site) lyase [Geobacteraceae bacterium]NTW78643.1 bifunctional DNA-formamidopyrimidine glycosylase/DNA-(apurinic or apyrimidinic site) lyase [Geobacteraceae bacterium]
MPELPEVEVTRRRLERELIGSRFKQVVPRVKKLRLPVPANLDQVLSGRMLRAIARRGKYLLFDCEVGWLLVHLGMTGFLKLLRSAPPPGKHDHLDFIFEDGQLLRFYDPRKFGVVTWFIGDPQQHPLLAEIGPEPLGKGFEGEYLFGASRGRKVAVKQLIMNSAVVAGVGNIYANEALFRARIRPDRAAGDLTPLECTELVATIRDVLKESIKEGDACLVAEETVAYYPQTFKVYGRSGESCHKCNEPLEEIRIGGRSTVFCRGCQK